jgi:hypothetical protein
MHHTVDARRSRAAPVYSAPPPRRYYLPVHGGHLDTLIYCDSHSSRRDVSVSPIMHHSVHALPSRAAGVWVPIAVSGYQCSYALVKMLEQNI